MSERPTRFSSAFQSTYFSIVLIDFGKASLIDHGKSYCLTWIERAEYARKYPHLAPELIDGNAKQNKKTDIFSAGVILHRVIDSLLFNQLLSSKKNAIAKLATNCRSSKFYIRPSSKAVLDSLKALMT